MPQGIHMIAVGQLVPNLDQPRGNFDTEALAELAESILQQSVIQLILAEKRDDGRFLIIAGLTPMFLQPQLLGNPST